MTEVCPYCRAPIAAEEAVKVCEGCGTKHHEDCYAENAGCTIFGCSQAPAEEPKLTVSAPELSGSAPAAVAVAASPVPPPSVAPPPMPGGSAVSAPAQDSLEELRQSSSHVVPSMFGLSGPEIERAALPDLEPGSQGPPKNRTTFIVLGALLGALGAHNFYAGYTKKGIIQLAITVCTLGLGSPMSWIWAIIDICTVNQDKYGVQFQS